MTRRTLRRSGGETTTERAYRLAEAALASWQARHVPLSEGALVEFFVVGFLACAQDIVEERGP